MHVCYTRFTTPLSQPGRVHGHYQGRRLRMHDHFRRDFASILLWFVGVPVDDEDNTAVLTGVGSPSAHLSCAWPRHVRQLEH